MYISWCANKRSRFLFGGRSDWLLGHSGDDEGVLLLLLLLLPPEIELCHLVGFDTFYRPRSPLW